MSCYAPIIAYWSKVVVEGRRQVTFSLRDAWSPNRLSIPCGKCIGCRTDKARQWAMRCQNEMRMHSENVFITLTYDDDHLPVGGSLVKRDLQLFLKRLRKKLAPRKVRHYACGEYGSKSGRAHYHLLIFGWAPASSDRRARPNCKSGNNLYNSVTLNSLWDMGHVVCGDVSPASCLYVAKYVTKKFIGPPDAKDRHYSVDLKDGKILIREPEFALMSKRPGLGREYVSKYANELLAHDTVIMDGHPVPLPRYYNDQLVKQNFLTQVEYEKLKTKRKRNDPTPKSERSPARLHVREAVANTNLKLLSKEKL